MPISPISTFNNGVNLNAKKSELKGTIKFDEGRPYLAIPLEQDTFESKGKAVKQYDDGFPMGVIFEKQAPEAPKQGCSHEDFIA